MKVCMILVAVVAGCVAQPPPGWHPSGRALLLPSRIQEEPTTTPAPKSNSTQSDDKQSERVLDSGEYYVLLEDGRLQMVKYTTAALTEQEDAPAKNQQPQPQQAQQYPQSSKTQYPVYPQYQPAQQYQQPQQYRSYSSGASTVSQKQVNPESFAQFQLEYVQFPLPGSQFAQTKLQYTVPEADTKPDAEEQGSDAKETTGYEATVQYRDVKPISAPIYAYNPAPLIRILKK